MSTVSRFEPVFVESFPDRIEEGKLYVSMSYASVAHNCACGCGTQVITPLSPTDWSLFFDGDTVSLDPSIGNWSFPCRSHYFIKRNAVRFAGSFDKQQIARVRELDRDTKSAYYSGAPSDTPAAPQPFSESQGLLARFARWLGI